MLELTILNISLLFVFSDVVLFLVKGNDRGKGTVFVLPWREIVGPGAVWSRNGLQLRVRVIGLNTGFVGSIETVDIPGHIEGFLVS